LFRRRNADALALITAAGVATTDCAGRDIRQAVIEATVLLLLLLLSHKPRAIELAPKLNRTTSFGCRDRKRAGSTRSVRCTTPYGLYASNGMLML